ncbi:50S ribosomal protein L18Ae [uncultured archaeon]|nr:50S ribosomal protein L18Ae [uncultured archaeon]
MVKFTVSGTVGIPNGTRKFEKEVEARSERHAKDLVYALFGSVNGVNRKKVKIESVAKV